MNHQASNEAEALYSSGVQKYFFKNYAGAIADLTKAIELKPGHTEAISYRDVAVLRLKESGSDDGSRLNQ